MIRTALLLTAAFLASPLQAAESDWRTADPQNVLVIDTEKGRLYIELHPEMPTGPLNRVADNALAKQLLGWEPRVMFNDGLHRTIDWYFGAKDRELIASGLATRLTER